MITADETTSTRPERSRRRRATLVGAVAALTLVGGAGVAYAAGERPVETGYAAVVEESDVAPAQGSDSDCPDRGSDQTSDQTPDQTPGDF